MRSANFVEETTTIIGGTNGDGAITLSAIANIPRFSTVFGSQATTIRYVIEDTVNKKFETGVGVVSANILTRTKPQITWDGSVWNDRSPSPLQFGSTPTLGNIRVRLSATAESQNATIPGFNRTVNANDNTWRDYHVNGALIWNGNGSGNEPLTADRVFYTCRKVEVAGKLDGIAVPISVASAGSSIKIALYSTGVNGLPANRIVTFNNIDASTTGVKIDNETTTWSTGGSVWLTPGWYYLAYVTNGVPAISSNSAPQLGLIGPTPLGRSNAYGWAWTVYESGSYTSGLPDSPNPSVMIAAQSILSGPWIGLRITP